MNLKMRYYGSVLSLADVDPNNSYGWKLSFRKGGVYSFLISIIGAPHLGARIRHKILTKIIKSTKNKKLVLDVGCGFGLESLYLSKEGYSVWGLDSSKAKIEIAKKLAKELKDTKIQFILGDIYKFESDKKFNTIILFEVLEHIKKPKRVLKKISRLLKKDGILIVSCPAPHGINAFAKEYLGHEVAGYSPKEIQKLIEGTKLNIKKIYSFGGSWLAKIFFYIDFFLLRLIPIFSAVFFFLSYPVVVFDQEFFKSKKPLGYVFVLRKK